MLPSPVSAGTMPDIGVTLIQRSASLHATTLNGTTCEYVWLIVTSRWYAPLPWTVTTRQTRPTMSRWPALSSNVVSLSITHSLSCSTHPCMLAGSAALASTVTGRDGVAWGHTGTQGTHRDLFADHQIRGGCGLTLHRASLWLNDECHNLSVSARQPIETFSDDGWEVL